MIDCNRAVYKHRLVYRTSFGCCGLDSSLVEPHTSALAHHRILTSLPADWASCTQMQSDQAHHSCSIETYFDQPYQSCNPLWMLWTKIPFSGIYCPKI